MPTRNKSWKPEHSFQNPNKKRKKSGKKYKKVYERYYSLMKKKNKEWDTKRIYKTMLKCQSRLTKFGITQTMVDEYVAKKSK